MNKLFLALTIILFTLTTSVNGQRITVQGFLKDSITHYPIAGGVITNVNTQKKITTDAKGYFSITAAPKDFFYILAKSYKYDTLTYTFLAVDTLTIYLSPAPNLLPTATVRTTTTRYQSDSTERRAAFEAGLAPRLSTVSRANNNAFGVGINLDKFFKKRYRMRGSGERIFDVLEQSAYVDYRYSPHLIASYTGMKGDTLKAFIQATTPAFEWLRAHPTNEDVLYYVNEKLKEFKVSDHVLFKP